MNNVNKIVGYILQNAGKLTPAKIQALGQVIKSLGGEKNPATHEPNTIPVAENYEEFTASSPLDFNDITGFQFEGEGKRHPVQIHGLEEKHGQKGIPKEEKVT